MNAELFSRIAIQLEPELAQEFGYAILEDKRKLKALEIIKEKNVDVWSLKNCLPELTYEKYLQVNKIPQFAFSEMDLTQEEFDFLKEILK